MYAHTVAVIHITLHSMLFLNHARVGLWLEHVSYVFVHGPWHMHVFMLVCMHACVHEYTPTSMSAHDVINN